MNTPLLLSMACEIKQDGKRIVERGYTNPTRETKRASERGGRN